MDRVTKHDAYDPAMESPWNRRSTATEAFGKLIARLPVRHVLVSYSDESLVDREELLEICKAYGQVDVNEIDYKRNIMSQIGNAAKHSEPDKNQRNKELLIHIAK